MAKPSIILSHLKDYLGEKNLPQRQREDLIDRRGTFLCRLAIETYADNDDEEFEAKSLLENEVKDLIQKIESYSFDHYHLYNLIRIFEKNESDLNDLYLTLNEPTIANLGQLLGIAERYDKAYRDVKGSTEKLFSEAFDTCVAAVAVLLKSLFAVIAIPAALAVGFALSHEFAIHPYEPLQGFLSWFNSSVEDTTNHAKNVKKEYSELTYDETTQYASTLHSFFNQKIDTDSSTGTVHYTNGRTITDDDIRSALPASSFLSPE